MLLTATTDCFLLYIPQNNNATIRKRQFKHYNNMVLVSHKCIPK